MCDYVFFFKIDLHEEKRLCDEKVLWVEGRLCARLKFLVNQEERNLCGKASQQEKNGSVWSEDENNVDLCDQKMGTLFTCKYVWVGWRKEKRKKRIKLEWCLAVMYSSSAVALEAHSGVDWWTSGYGVLIPEMAANDFWGRKQEGVFRGMKASRKWLTSRRGPVASKIASM